jgi:hypothetical protein
MPQPRSTRQTREGGPRRRVTLIGLVLPLDKPARPRALLLLAPGFAGVALIAWRGLADAGAADILMLLGASLSWALGTVVSERHAGEIPANALAGAALVSGGLVLLGLAAATGELLRIDPAGLVGMPGLAWLHLTLLGTVVTFGAYVWLLERVSPPLVGTYTYVNPIVAVALGWAVLGEALTIEMLAGGTLVLGSLVALLWLDPPEARSKHKEERHVRPLGVPLLSSASAPPCPVAAPCWAARWPRLSTSRSRRRMKPGAKAAFGSSWWSATTAARSRPVSPRLAPSPPIPRCWL